MTILFEQLWNGQIIPYNRCGQNDPEVEELAELVERNRAALECELGEQQVRRFKTYISCCEEYTYLVTVHAFREGFSLASRLLTDALTEYT